MISKGEAIGYVSGLITSPKTFYSKHSELTVKFTSDGYGQERGFEAVYKLKGKLQVIIYKCINVCILIKLYTYTPL